MSDEQRSENGARAEFDFSRVGYGWAKRFMRVTSRLGSMEAILEAPEAEGLSEFDRKRLSIARAEAVGEMPDLNDARDALICQVLVSVPREWLIGGAPADLDWSDPASLEWLRDIRPLLDALSEAQAAAQKK